MTQFGAWLSTPNVPAIEMLARSGYHAVVLDAEHGTFELQDLNTVIPFARGLGLRTYVKAAAPERAPIPQQRAGRVRLRDTNSRV